jgi:hypothetical protein
MSPHQTWNTNFWNCPRRTHQDEERQSQQFDQCEGCLLDLISGGRIGGRLAPGRFLTPTRPVKHVPRSTHRHMATNGPFCFRTLICCQFVYDRIDRCMADQHGDSISIRHGVCGDLMSLELTVTDGITMVGLDD